MPDTPKIAIHGFGAQPVVCRHLIEMSKAAGAKISWCTILTSPHYRGLMRDVLPAQDICDVYEELPRTPGAGDLAQLSNYVGSIAEDLAAQKRLWPKRQGVWLQRRAQDYYRLYKSFLLARGATHVLMSSIESPDGKILAALAQELGLGLMAPVDARNVTGTYFSTDAYETPPEYGPPSDAHRTQAAELVTRFKSEAISPRRPPIDIDAATDDQTRLEGYLPPLRRRMAGFASAARERPDLFDGDMIRASVLNNLPLMRNAIWGTRARLNRGNFDIADINNLPKRFVFYPLHYTPESSINTPAPYFVDQFRVIDALRFAMPSDCELVVKEHWACLPMRPVRFMNEVRRLPGVRVANYTIPARSLIERAGLTATVTGTAGLEAFLLGRPAIALGRGISAWTLGGVEPLGTLPERVHLLMDKPVPEQHVIEQIARIMSVRYPFYFATPHTAGEPMLRAGNMKRFLAAIIDHLRRTAVSRTVASTPDAQYAPAPLAFLGKRR